jgi:heme/copper-type cytochrome/quinol oxidase subunit 4
VAAQNKTTKKSKKSTEESKLRRWFSHGSGGHLVVIGFIILITITFLIYAASQGTLKQYTYLIVLLVVTVIVQLVLWLRIRNQSK